MSDPTNLRGRVRRLEDRHGLSGGGCAACRDMPPAVIQVVTGGAWGADVLPEPRTCPRCRRAQDVVRLVFQPSCDGPPEGIPPYEDE